MLKRHLLPTALNLTNCCNDLANYLLLFLFINSVLYCGSYSNLLWSIISYTCCRSKFFLFIILLNRVTNYYTNYYRNMALCLGDSVLSLLSWIDQSPTDSEFSFKLIQTFNFDSEAILSYSSKIEQLAKHHITSRCVWNHSVIKGYEVPDKIARNVSKLSFIGTQAKCGGSCICINFLSDLS